MHPARKRLVFIVASLVAVYFVWGSTYLALVFGLEGFPPFILNGIRFLVAGVLVFGYGLSKGIELPTRTEWWNAGRIGFLLLVGGVGLVTIAEDVGVGSGLAATAVAVMPLWAAVISGFFGSWPRRMEWFGLSVGFAGVVILAAEGDFQATRTGAMLMIIAPVLWAFGSVWGKRLRLPSATMTAAAQLLAAGVVLLVLGPLRGERIDGTPGAGAWLALGYLIVFGSIVGYTAYVYLLKEVRPALATSYAYVNPVVAVVLGISLGGEILTGPAYVALPLILSGVALVTLGSRNLPAAKRHGGLKVTREAAH
ncbi:MAG: drug/metabolite exporter YedA [Acidimicrobiia bacterium]